MSRNPAGRWRRYGPLLQGFLGLGLLVGIAGLGVVTVHAVRDPLDGTCVCQAASLVGPRTVAR